MTQEEIVALHDEIFAFLFEKYLEARAKGEEFYFRIANTQDPNFWAVYFWSTSDSASERNDSCVNIDILINIYTSTIYLFISEKIRFFQLRQNDDIQEVDDKIYKWQLEVYQDIGKIVLGKNLNKELPGFYMIEEADIAENIEEHAVKQYSSNSSVIENLSDFLKKDKIAIDIYLRDKEYKWFIEKYAFVKYVSNVRQSQFMAHKNNFEIGLPFCIRGFTFWDYKAIKHLSIDNIPATTRWIFLTGENGIGKTLVLEAIALSLQLAEWQLSINKSTQVLAIEYQTDVRMVDSYSSLLGSPPNDIPVAAYGCNRFNEAENPENIGISHLFDKRSLIDIDLWLNELLQKIKSNEQGILSDEAQLAKDKYTFNILLACFQRILAIHNIRLDDNNETVLYEETDENGKIIYAVPFAALSAGYKNILRITADMIVQLSHVWLPTHTKSYEIQAPKDLAGIVIIDEFENHLHAKFQRKWVEILTDLFPNVQFIVSTHSPIPLLGAPKESVILHVERTKEEGITVERLDDIISFKDLLPNALLSSPIFGLYNLIPSDRDSTKMLGNPNSYEETVFEEILTEKLRKFREESDFDFEKFKNT